MRRVRGGTLLTVLVVVALATMAAFTVAGASYYNLMASQRLASATAARNLAESVLTQAVARLARDREFGSHAETLRIDRRTIPDLGEEDGAVVTFDPALGLPTSTWNVTGEVGTRGWKGATVPRQSVHLMARGVSNGSERIVEALVHFPRFAFTVASTGDLVLDHAMVAAIPNPDDVRRDGSGKIVTPPEDMQPGDALSNRKMFVKNSSLVTGDAQAHLEVAVDRNSVVEGELRRPVAPEDIPLIDIATFDPGDREYSVELDAAIDGQELAGVQRASGSLAVNGDLALDNALLYVPGDLTVNGGLRGTGAVFVTGNVLVKGATNLTAADGVALLAGGDLHLQGSSTDRQVFQGLLYSRGNLLVEKITVLGTVICHGRLGSERLVLNETRLIWTQTKAGTEFFRPLTFLGNSAGPYSENAASSPGRPSLGGKKAVLVGQPPTAATTSPERAEQLANAANWVPLAEVWRRMKLLPEPISGPRTSPAGAWDHPVRTSAPDNTWDDPVMITVRYEKDRGFVFTTTHHGALVDGSWSGTFIVEFPNLQHMSQSIGGHAEWLAGGENLANSSWAGVVAQNALSAMAGVGLDPDNPNSPARWPTFRLDPSQFVQPEDRIRVLLWRDWKDPDA